MCYGHGGHHAQDNYCACGCHIENHRFHRHFLSKAERVERLKDHLADLKSEMQGVEEEIKRLSEE